MKTLIKKCPKCGSYTARDLCPKCRARTSSSAPPRYGPEDRYGGMRRKETYPFL